MERFLPGESGPGYKCGMSLRSVTIEGFRCFRHLEVQGLTRVNLVVGRNNSGKTSFLEAVEALVSEASPTVLYRSSIDRGEYKLTRDSDDDEHLAIDVRRWFYGHRLEPGVTLSIRDSGDGNLALTRAIVRSEQLASSINPALSRPELGRPPGHQIVEASTGDGGFESALERFRAALEARRPTRLGLLVDRDGHEGRPDRWPRVAGVLRQAGLEVPEAPPANGIRITRNSQRVGAWLMPNNTDLGDLEGFLEALLPDPRPPLWQYAGVASTAADALVDWLTWLFGET